MHFIIIIIITITIIWQFFTQGDKKYINTINNTLSPGLSSLLLLLLYYLLPTPSGCLKTHRKLIFIDVKKGDFNSQGRCLRSCCHHIQDLPAKLDFCDFKAHREVVGGMV